MSCMLVSYRSSLSLSPPRSSPSHSPKRLLSQAKLSLHSNDNADTHTHRETESDIIKYSVALSCFAVSGRNGRRGRVDLAREGKGIELNWKSRVFGAKSLDGFRCLCRGRKQNHVEKDEGGTVQCCCCCCCWSETEKERRSIYIFAFTHHPHSTNKPTLASCAVRLCVCVLTFDLLLLCVCVVFQTTTIIFGIIHSHDTQ